MSLLISHYRDHIEDACRHYVAAAARHEGVDVTRYAARCATPRVADALSLRLFRRLIRFRRCFSYIDALLLMPPLLMPRRCIRATYGAIYGTRMCRR